MALPDLNRSLIRDTTVPIEPGQKFNKYRFAGNQTMAAILTTGFFNFARGYLRPGDRIECFSQIDTPADSEHAYVKVLTVPVTGDITISASEEAGITAGARNVVPTANGLTTGLILPTDRFVHAESGNMDHILTLPLATADTRGKQIRIWVAPSTNCELRTPAASTQTINNVNSDGTNEALLAHSHLYVCTQHLATGWLLEKFTALGAVATAVVPD